MIEIGIIIALVLAVGGWLKTRIWYPNSYIPAAVILSAIALNLLNAFLFGGDLLEAGKLAFIEGIAAIGIHSATKNTVEKK